ncbi:MAG TPA: hypothetical protein HPP97_00080 [Desulfuromonadales bacterium]|nr:hypothetical protein [Desulfuromonadales bacterium]
MNIIVTKCGVQGMVEKYPRFFEYGDAESRQKGLERLRRHYPKEDSGVKNEGG